MGGFDGVPMQVMTLVYAMVDGRVLMLERGLHKTFLPGWVMGPGGKVEPGEDILAAGAREFREETGLTVQGLKLRGSYTYYTNREVNRSGVMYLLVGDGVSGEFKAEVADGTLRWLTLEEIYANDKTFADHKTFIRMLFETDDHVACLGGWQDGVLMEWADSAAYYEARKAA